MFVGDIMVGRYVETLIDNNGFDYMFASVTPMFMNTLTIANLEGPIPAKHVHTPNIGFQFSFRQDIVQKLSDIGLDVVSLANNHGYDHGVAGYTNTKKVLGNMGVAYFGNYTNTANDYFETELGGKKVIVHGINVIVNDFDRKSAINSAKFLVEKNPDAYVITFMHWGNEYDLIHNAYQEELAHDLVDAGVDAIIGSHPHVVQDVETYNGARIYYSLGNFIFDQYFSKETQEGLVVLMDVVDGKLVFEEKHIKIDRSRPYFLDWWKLVNTIAIV
jgi:poly-gamma-glutamate synthesis protein (capsule biosynthesis protein)